VHDLLRDFRGLCEELDERLEAERLGAAPDPLSVFLLLAGLHQVVEDHLHREPDLVERAEARLRELGRRGAGPARALASARRLGSRARSERPGERRLVDWSESLGDLLEEAAREVVAPGEGIGARAIRRAWRSLRTAVPRIPEPVLDALANLPNPFATFDQLPGDCAELMRRFASRWPDRGRPVLVLGVRTSGTYLAPLQSSALRTLGYRHVEMLTARAGQRWRRSEEDMVRAAGGRGGIVVLTDDPPASGRTLAALAGECVELGVPREAVVLSLGLLGPESSLPEPLRSHPSVLLPWAEWAIQERLSPPSVRAALGALLDGRQVRGPGGEAVTVRSVEDVARVDGTPESASAPRRHARGRYRVRLAGVNGERIDHRVLVRGTGLGHFAGYPRAVAAALCDYLPELHGMADGLLYRALPPEDRRADRTGWEGVEGTIASYVLARRERLPVDPRRAARAVEDRMSFDLVADMLGWALLHSQRMLAFPLTWEAARRLLAHDRPALVDGAMAASNWYLPSPPPAAGALKEAADEDAFANAAKLSYDPLFDLASAAASFAVEETLRGGPPPGRPPFPERLRSEFAARSGEPVDGERWLLHQLLHNRYELSQLRERGPSPEDGGEDGWARRLLAVERALAAAEQQYVADLYLSDLEVPREGPLCAIDVDWTLESRWLDFPALTPLGAIALRALARHGYRPLIATGRSLAEVRRRCRAYRLAGGVAEYGAVAYDNASGRTLDLLPPAQSAQLARLREQLRRMPGVRLDEEHGHSVRALRLTDDGRRRGLSEEAIAEALDGAGVEGSVQVVYGHLQTDFTPAAASKGTGVLALAEALGGGRPAGRPLAFAIGDDSPDAPMLALADHRFAPGNAGPDLLEELGPALRPTVVEGRQAAGLLEAVGAFLGHEPRHCDTCAVPRPPGRTRLLTGPLAALDGPRPERVRQLLALAALLGRSTAGSALRASRAPR
jgi:hydroxymethylpyrimidine pyrophosphatase-like HAD family hydrolase